MRLGFLFLICFAILCAAVAGDYTAASVSECEIVDPTGPEDLFPDAQWMIGTTRDSVLIWPMHTIPCCTLRVTESQARELGIPDSCEVAWVEIEYPKPKAPSDWCAERGHLWEPDSSRLVRWRAPPPRIVDQEGRTLKITDQCETIWKHCLRCGKDSCFSTPSETTVVWREQGDAGAIGRINDWATDATASSYTAYSSWTTAWATVRLLEWAACITIEPWWYYASTPTIEWESTWPRRSVE